MSQAQIDGQIPPNNSEAATLGLTNFNPANLVTPGVSGLSDSAAPAELVNDGIHYVVTDTSVLGVLVVDVELVFERVQLGVVVDLPPLAVQHGILWGGDLPTVRIFELGR